MTTQFWSNDPTILLNKEHILELWPTENMNYEQKLNAISRMILLITILGYMSTSSTKILWIGLVTLIGIFILWKQGPTSMKSKITKETLNEGFANIMVNNKPTTLDSVLNTEFREGTKKNPFSNVLLTQIGDSPDRKAAPPAFNIDVSEDITKNVKKAIQMLNPEIKDTNKQLFGDMYQEMELDNFQRQLVSTANTRVTNDSISFANFLYGDMPSSKGTDFASNVQREKDSYRHILM